MKPISQQTTEAVVQFDSQNSKFFLKTKQRWGIFRWWKTIYKLERIDWVGTKHYNRISFDTKAAAEDYAKSVGLTIA